MHEKVYEHIDQRKQYRQKSDCTQRRQSVMRFYNFTIPSASLERDTFPITEIMVIIKGVPFFKILWYNTFYFYSLGCDSTGRF